MHYLVIAFVSVLAARGGAPVSAAALATRQQPSAVESLVQQASVVFTGRVQKPGSSNVEVLPATARTATVRVLEVVDAPPALGNLTGQDVTLELRAPDSVTAGQEAVFYANGWLWAEHIALREVGHTAITHDIAALKEQVSRTRGTMQDARLRARVDSATVVVSGRVTSIRKATMRLPGRPGSEHDPDWWEATLDVRSIDKGQLPERRATVFFPRSIDVMWAQAPKFREGQEGVWLLHTGEPAPAGRAPAPYYTALDPLDFQPLDRLEHIRSLIRAPR